jgi:hypothetical protein
MKGLSSLLAASLAVPDTTAGKIQGVDFGFFYVDGTGEHPMGISGIDTLEKALVWLSNNSGGSYDSYVIQLDTDEALADKQTLAYGKAVTILLRASGTTEVRVSRVNGKADGLLVIGAEATLELGAYIVIAGNDVKLADYIGYISVQKGTLRMKEHSKITGVKVSSDGGAVLVGLLRAGTPVSTFEIEGGNILENLAQDSDSPERAPASYAAVMVNASGNVLISGGSITGNTRGVVLGGQGASLLMILGVISGNGKMILADGSIGAPDNGMRGSGVCIGTNQMPGAVEIRGGTFDGNGIPAVATTPPSYPPGGGVYSSSSAAKCTLNGSLEIGSDNTVCLTNTKLSLYPVLVLGKDFTNDPSDAPITLDFESTRTEWIESWVGKQVLKLADDSTATIAALKGRFELGNFYTSSGNQPFVLFGSLDPAIPNSKKDA